MSRWRPWKCRGCGSEKPPISARGWCEDCAIERQTKSAVQLVARSGPYYERWREAMRRVADEA